MSFTKLKVHLKQRLLYETERAIELSEFKETSLIPDVVIQGSLAVIFVHVQRSLNGPECYRKLNGKSIIIW